MKGKFTRRELIRSAALAAGAAALGACTKVVQETVVKEKEVTKVVEKVITATPVPQSVTLVFFRAESECAQYSLVRDKLLVFDWWEEATGIHIEFDVVAQQDYEQVFNLRAAAGSIKADIIQMQGTSDASYLARLYNDKTIISLDELLDNNAPYTLALSQKYPAYRKDLSLSDGGFIAIGDASVSPYDMRVWSIRQDWLDKLGLDMPKTLEDLGNVAEAFATRDPNGNGNKDEVGMLSADGLWGLIVQSGYAYGLVGMVDGWHIKDGKVVNDWIDPHFFDVFTFLNNCVKRGAVPPDYDDPNIGFGSVLTRAYNGQLGLWSRAPLVLPALLNWSENEMQKTDPTARWVNTPLPPTPEGVQVSDVEPIATRWRTYGITSQCKEPALAMGWLDFVFASPQGQEIWNYGKEGETFTRNADGTITKLFELDEANAVKEGKYAGRYWGNCVTMPMVNTAEATEKGLADWQAPDWCMPSIEDMLPFGRVAGQTPILAPDKANQVAALMNDVKTYKNEMWAKFVAGDTPINKDTFDEYVATLEKLGLAEVRDMFQEAVS